jgi:uncharacterized SAM-binding protein YcdF (DUF218 family)
LFERAGFAVESFPVDYQVSEKSGLTVLRYLPNADALAESERALREVMGLLYYRLRSFIGLD